MRPAAAVGPGARSGDAAGRPRIAAHARSCAQVAADLVALTKPRVVLMVVVTTMVGYHVGLAGRPAWLRLIALAMGTVLAAGGTLALNQYLERDVDALMTRTRGRPLPGGRLRPVEALTFGLALTLSGLAVLGLSAGALAAAITGTTSALYLFAYTPLKLRTPLCTLVGAVPGALPPVTGWVAAHGGLDAGALALFGILFLWQLPHTLSIARLHRDDYARAGIRMLPVVDTRGTCTARLIVAGCIALLAVSLLPVLVDLAGRVYLVGAAVSGLALVAVGAAELAARSPHAGRAVLRASVLYLPVLLALLALDAR